MARSKNFDSNRSPENDVARFDESGMSGSKHSKHTKNGSAKTDDSFATRSDTKDTFAKADTFPKGDSFHRDWHDDSGRAEKPFADQELGASAKLADDIRGAASSAVKAVKEQASAVANEVGHELGKTAEHEVNRGADAIRGFASAIEKAGAELEKVSPHLARYVNDSAGRIRNVSDGLSNRQVNDLIGTATDFARSQPAIFFGAAVVTGFALARFLKSSAKSNQPDVMTDDTMGRDDGDFYPSSLNS